jgi:hypothetical protein
LSPAKPGQLALRRCSGTLGRDEIREHPRSRAVVALLLIGSEGDTDPDIYSRIVGNPAREVTT